MNVPRICRRAMWGLERLSQGFGGSLQGFTRVPEFAQAWSAAFGFGVQ